MSSRCRTRGRRARRSGTPRAGATFANDPLNLLAVDGPTNASKSDGDAATWLPPQRSYRCRFVARQVAVKAKWKLSVTAAERDAMARVSSTLPRAARAELISSGGAPPLRIDGNAKCSPSSPA